MTDGKRLLRPGWILGPRRDALIFTGPVLAALALIAYADWRGVLHDDMPPWMFALLIIACDVAHVYATAFRVYLDPARFKKRPGLYLGVPLMCFAGGVLLYSAGATVFWRTLAYLAVWHFIRQQWGWVSYARAQAGEGAVDRRLDQLTIYAITLYPIVFWHAHLPRAFHWFVEGDFVALPAVIATLGAVLHWTVVAAFVVRQIQRVQSGAGVNFAKLHIVFTTWIAWYGGIVLLDSDIAFTALNVLSHGVPYLAVVWAVESRYASQGDGGAGDGDEPQAKAPLARLFKPQLAVLFLALLVLVGYSEEWLWDSLVWQDHDTLFPFRTADALPVAALSIIVPLLAMPQATHYVLDGWLWRRREHADVGSLIRSDS